MPTYHSSSCVAWKNCRVRWCIACYISCIKVYVPQKNTETTIAWFSFVRMKGDETQATLLLRHQPQATRSLNKLVVFFTRGVLTNVVPSKSKHVEETNICFSWLNAFLGWITDINTFLFIFHPSTASPRTRSSEENPAHISSWADKKNPKKHHPKNWGSNGHKVSRSNELGN